MRNTVVLLLLVAFASAVPVAEDADERNILQILQNANPYENDIIGNDDLVLSKTNKYENEAQEIDENEFISTTEYTLESKPEISTDSPQITVVESETEPQIDLDTKDVSKAESMPEEKSGNATNLDSTIEKEQQFVTNLDSEIANEPNDSIEAEDTLSVEEIFAPMIIESPKYSIKFPEIIPELETTDSDDTSMEDGLYNNEEWPQRYAPDFPALPDTQQMEQGNFNMEEVPEVPINTFGNQGFSEVPISEIYDPSIIGPMDTIRQMYNEQYPEQFPDNVPAVNPEVNQFGEDGIPYGIIEDITIEPIYYDQVPKYYDDTPKSSLNGEPQLMAEEPNVALNSNENPEEEVELIVIDEEMSEMPFTPIAEEVEQPQDSPIIPTAILQDTRPDVELLGLFGDSGEPVIIEEVEQPQGYPIIPTAVESDIRPDVDLLGLFDSSEPVVIEENIYPSDGEVFTQENLPASDETFEQGDVIISNLNIPAVEDEAMPNPFGMLPPLNGNFEQPIISEISIVQEPTIAVIEDDQMVFNKNNNQRIYFQDEVRENLHIFPGNPQSNPNFMAPLVHDQMPMRNDFYQPNYRGDIPPTEYNDNVPHTHNEHQFNFDNVPQNQYFDDISVSRKRDGAHIVPDMDNMEMPIGDMGGMEMLDSEIAGPTNPSATPQITVILVTKPQQVKRVWSQFIRPMQQKPFLPADMQQNERPQPPHRFNNEIQGNGPLPFGNMGQFPQSPDANRFNQNYYGQNFNPQPMQNYNSYQNMNSPQNQMFNSGMNPFAANFDQLANMGSMFPNLDMDMDLAMEDLEFIPLEEMENMFESQQPRSPYGPSMYPFPNNQQNWPNRYAPNFQGNNFGNNEQFYPTQDMNRPFFIPA